MPPEYRQCVELILGRQQNLESSVWDDHQPEFLRAEVEVAHVAAFEPQPVTNTGRRRLLGRDREHRRRQIEAGDANSSLGQLDSDTAGPDPDLQDLAGRAVSEIAVERDITPQDRPATMVDRIVNADVQGRAVVERPTHVVPGWS